jgi:uncharacterized protein (DUF924 family)
MPMDVINRVLTFWFDGNFEDRRKVWFIKSNDFDAKIKIKFGDDVEKASTATYDFRTQTPEGALGLIILLDQFPRNIFRGNPQTFATDLKALRIAKQAVADGLDANLTVVQKVFFYLPFEHSENMEDQNQALKLFEALGDESYLKYAVAHRDVIERFGRFPHRNKMLGRASTEEEIRFLKNFKSF